MPKIKTYQDGTASGTFSQINIEDGNNILISLTKSEIAIFKVGFLGIPYKKLWTKEMNAYLDIVYPQGPSSENFGNQSVLEFSVDIAMDCSTLDEVLKKFTNLS